MVDNEPTLEKSDLVKPVQQLLSDDTVDVLTWELKPLGSSNNPINVGVFKVNGQASTQNAVVQWTMVLKIIQSPANVGMAWLGDDTNHWNYWRREAHVFETDFLVSVPQVFVVPKCYGVVEKAGKVVWLWLEFIDNSCEEWSIEHLCGAAYHLGRFNGAYLLGHELPQHQWLSRRVLRQWIHEFDAGQIVPYWKNADQQMLFWEHAMIQKSIGAPDVNVLYQFLQERIRFIDIIERLPQTLCHRDCFPTNLMCVGNDEQIALIDWALVGIGTVAEDLFQLMMWIIIHEETFPLFDAIETKLFAHYLQGLRDGGWQGDEKLVRFAYVASFVLRAGHFLIIYLNKPPVSSNSVNEASYDLESLNNELLLRHSRLIEIVLKHAQEAFELLEQLEAK
jgi:hypothetical protein